MTTPHSTTLNIEELSIVEEETGDQHSEAVVETCVDWNSISGAQHQNAFTLLRDKMNEQLVGERRGKKNAEEEWGERVRSVRETLELEVNSLQYKLSSQLMTLELSKEVSRLVCVSVFVCVSVWMCSGVCVCECICLCVCVCVHVHIHHLIYLDVYAFKWSGGNIE